MQNLARRLEKKGWEKKEIAKAAGIIKKAKESRSGFEKNIYWVLLIVIITANFAISIALMPLLIALRGFALYFIIAVVGIVFGLLFELVIRSIEHLENRHHLLLAFFIPIIALASIFVISRISNSMAADLGLQNIHSPLLVGIVYAASFVLPYIIYRFVLRIEYYSQG